MTRIARKTVLVTGGAAGMGALFARRCLQRGAARVVLWDVDRTALKAQVDALATGGADVRGAVVDVANAEEVERTASALLDDLADDAVDILFNNAGVVVGKPFHEHGHAEIRRSIDINVLGVMHTTRALLPAMIRAGRGHVINMASAAALTPNPNMSVYASSKWAVLGWSESLRIELQQLSPELRVTTVCPSYVKTGMFAGARAPLWVPLLDPEPFVDEIVRAVERDRILLRRPLLVNALPFLRGILPARVYDVLVGRGFGIYSSMDRFTGHQGRGGAGANPGTPLDAEPRG